MKKYSLSHGVALARRIHDIVLIHGYSVGLTGSTLKTDEGSDDDIDIIVYPLKTRESVTPVRVLEGIIDRETSTNSGLQTPPELRTPYHENDDKHVVKFTNGEIPFDVLFLS